MSLVRLYCADQINACLCVCVRMLVYSELEKSLSCSVLVYRGATFSLNVQGGRLTYRNTHSYRHMRDRILWTGADLKGSPLRFVFGSYFILYIHK